MTKTASKKSRRNESIRSRDKALIAPLNLPLLALLLVLPVTALVRLQVDWRWATGHSLIVNALTYWTYARDKRRAQSGAWRVSEANLHLLELLGGWPAAFLAQRQLRHKCAKGSFLFLFWLIVLGYQCVALDSLQDWKFSRAALEWTNQSSGR